MSVPHHHCHKATPEVARVGFRLSTTLSFRVILLDRATDKSRIDTQRDLALRAVDDIALDCWTTVDPYSRGEIVPSDGANNEGQIIGTDIKLGSCWCSVIHSKSVRIANRTIVEESFSCDGYVNVCERIIGVLQTISSQRRSKDW